MVDSAAPYWSTEDLNAATDRIEAHLRAAHPELSDEAIHAIGNQYSYSWK